MHDQYGVPSIRTGYAGWCPEVTGLHSQGIEGQVLGHHHTAHRYDALGAVPCQADEVVQPRFIPHPIRGQGQHDGDDALHRDCSGAVQIAEDNYDH